MFEPTHFKTFGIGHLVTLVVLLSLGSLVLWAGGRLSRSKRAWLGRGLGCLLLGYVGTIYVQIWMAGELSWDNSLPLHLCHWVLAACLIALFRPSPLACEIAYFWGLSGTVQALITPEVGQGFPSWEFIQFFWAHGGIFLAIAHFIGGQNFRPRRGSVLRMFIAVNYYALIVGAIDKIFGWNYGYLCEPPSQPSLIDYLGPWPWYILSLEGIALVSFWALDLPWRLAGRPEKATKEIGQPGRGSE